MDQGTPAGGDADRESSAQGGAGPPASDAGSDRDLKSANPLAEPDTGTDVEVELVGVMGSGAPEPSAGSDGGSSDGAAEEVHVVVPRDADRPQSPPPTGRTGPSRAHLNRTPSQIQRVERVRRGFRRIRGVMQSIRSMRDTARRSRVVGHAGLEWRERRLSQRLVRERWMADPRHTWRQVWDVVLMGFVIYTLVYTPFDLAFGFEASVTVRGESETVTDFFRLLEWSAVVFFFGDILLNFRTAVVKDENEIIQRPAEVARIYLRWWFWIDLLSTFPFAEFMELIGVVPSAESAQAQGAKGLRFLRFFRLIRLVRILRVLRVSQFLQTLGDIGVFAQAALRVAKPIMWMAFSGHLVGCLWYFSADVNDLGADTWAAPFSLDDPEVGTSHRYLLAVYYAFVTITTVGYGDITPKNELERTVAILTTAIGTAAFAYVVGKVTALAAQAEASATEFYQKMSSVNELMRMRNLPSKLRDDIRLYYDTMFSRGVSYDEAGILKELSHGLRRKVLRCIHADTIQNVPFFESANMTLIDDVIKHLEPSWAMPNDVIVAEGETGSMLFLLRKGIVAVTINGVHVRDMSDGAFFGEEIVLAAMEKGLGAVAETTRTATCTAVVVCQLAVLPLEAVLDLVVVHPELEEAMKRVALARRMLSETGSFTASQAESSHVPGQVQTINLDRPVVSRRRSSIVVEDVRLLRSSAEKPDSPRTASDDESKGGTDTYDESNLLTSPRLDRGLDSSTISALSERRLLRALETVALNQQILQRELQKVRARQDRQEKVFRANMMETAERLERAFRHSTLAKSSGFSS